VCGCYTAAGWIVLCVGVPGRMRMARSEIGARRLILARTFTDTMAANDLHIRLCFCCLVRAVDAERLSLCLSVGYNGTCTVLWDAVFPRSSWRGGWTTAILV
jgi:hypothetical protein